MSSNPKVKASIYIPEPPTRTIKLLFLNNSSHKVLASFAKSAVLNSLKTVGYTEIFDFLDTKCTLLDAIEKIKQHSRNYAKRQSTWLKRYSDMNYLNPYSNEDLLAQAINKLSN